MPVKVCSVYALEVTLSILIVLLLVSISISTFVPPTKVSVSLSLPAFILPVCENEPLTVSVTVIVANLLTLKLAVLAAVIRPCASIVKTGIAVVLP